MKWKALRLFVLILILSARAPAVAMEVTPFFTRNQAPLVQIFGLPPAEGGFLAGEGRTDVRLAFDAGNTFTGGLKGEEELRLDGETHRLTLALRHGVSDRLEIGLDLPYVWHSGGEMDVVINSFHRTFNLPEGGRDEWYNNNFEYSFASGGETSFCLDEPQDGFGDLVLTAGIGIFREENPAGTRSLALRTGLKFPTGKGRELTGSGSTDFSLRLAGTDAATLASWRLTWYGALGALAMTEGDVLADLQQNFVGFGTLGMGWSPYSWLTFQVQMDGHTPFFHGSGLHQLDDTSVQVTFGPSLTLPGRVHADLAITEDLAVETAPDVVFHLSLWRRF